MSAGTPPGRTRREVCAGRTRGLGHARHNFERVQDNAAILDLGLGALIDDLFRRGVLDETLVVLTREFGRTPGIHKKKQDGRNHHPKA